MNKVFATLSNAYQLMQAEYGTIDTWGLKNTTNRDPETGEMVYDYSAQSLVTERFKKYLKVAKTCQIGQTCFGGAFYALNGTKLLDAFVIDASSDSPADANFYLSDGIFISFGWWWRNRGHISVILPGKDATLGKNRFFFVYNSKGVFPEGMKDATEDKFQNCDAADTTISSGRGCTAWVIYNKNMDYLHCRDELSWDGKHKCSD